MKSNLLIVLLFFLSGYLYGQVNFTVEVWDTEANMAISYAEVNVNNKNYKSSNKGIVVISVPKSGEYKIYVFKNEYNWFETILEINEESQHFKLELSPLSKKLSEVEIIARQKRTMFIEQLKPVEGTAIYAGKKSEIVYLDLIVANKANNTARQIYSKIAGLNIYEGNEGGLQLNLGGRGLDPNRSANFNTRQNGYDISADVLGYPESYYTPPADAIEAVQVVRGAASLQYGTQFGGLVNFKLKSPPLQSKLRINTKNTYGTFNLFNTFNSIEYGGESTQWYGLVNYKKGDGYRPNSNFDALNVYLSNKWHINSKLSMFADYTHMNYLMKQPGGLTDTQFELEPMYSNRDRNWFQVNWNMASLRFEYKIDSKSKFSWHTWGLLASRYALGFRGNVYDLNSNPIADKDFKIDDDTYYYPRDLLKGDFKNIGSEFRYLRTYEAFGKLHIWLLGFKFFQANNTSNQGPGSNYADADFDFYFNQFPDYPNQSSFVFPNQNIAVFSEHIFHINDKFSITPGIRGEYIHTKSEGTYQSVIYDIAGNAISNRLYSEIKSLPRTLVLLGVGCNYRFNDQTKLYANLSQNYRSVTFSDIRVVNPSFIIAEDISDERGFTSDVGIKGVKGRWHYDANLFGILYNDRIGIILDNRANRVRKNVGDALIAGVESLVEVELLKTNKQVLSTYMNGAITYSRYIKSEQNNVVGNQVEFLPFLNLKMGIHYGYKNWISSLQWTYLSEQYTDVENSAAAPAGDQREGLIGSIPSYHILDFSTKYSWKDFEFETGINNLLNQHYYTRRASGYPGPGIIPSDPQTWYITIGYSFHTK